ncbi:MAG: 23S rRNA (pseudouridine(1915)-N(3))-methyltransferase RlmH [Terracidiphilus sp.]
MHWTLAHIGPHSGARDPFDASVQLYLDRCAPFARCQAQAFKSEAALLENLARSSGRTPALPVLLDSRGRSLTSEAFAAWLGQRRDEGTQHILFAIGPADGWSDAARHRAHLLLALGSFTLAHSLARLILAEQLYRATTILTNHPYHSGH